MISSSSGRSIMKWQPLIAISDNFVGVRDLFVAAYKLRGFRFPTEFYKKVEWRYSIFSLVVR